MKIIYSHRAAQDLEDIYQYIYSNSPGTAQKFMADLGDYISQLQTFPEMGVTCRYEEIRNHGIRLLIKENYIVFYKIDKKEEVQIVRVLHGATDYRNIVT